MTRKEVRVHAMGCDWTHGVGACNCTPSYVETFNDETQDEGQRVVTERAKIRGDFRVQSKFSQEIKMTLRFGPNWQKMTPEQREALDEMANKIARILTGDPNEIDSWRDLAGYPTLIFNVLTKGTPT